MGGVIIIDNKKLLTKYLLHFYYNVYSACIEITVSLNGASFHICFFKIKIVG